MPLGNMQLSSPQGKLRLFSSFIISVTLWLQNDNQDD